MINVGAGPEGGAILIIAYAKMLPVEEILTVQCFFAAIFIASFAEHFVMKGEIRLIQK